MAHRVAKWVANDGSEWSTQEEAEARERLSAAVDVVMAPLGKLPENDSCRFANGHGFIQHSAETVKQVRLGLYEISKPHLGWWYDTQKHDHGKTDYELAVEVHPSWHSRMLDGGPRPLDRAYSRLCCIDKDFREWGQPYFANHPNEGEQIQLNK